MSIEFSLLAIICELSLIRIKYMKLCESLNGRKPTSYNL